MVLTCRFAVGLMARPITSQISTCSHYVTALVEVEKAYQGTAVKAEALGSMHPK
jgi:hypothetical protein